MSISAKRLALVLVCLATACGESEQPPPNQLPKKEARPPATGAPQPAKTEQQLSLPNTEGGAAVVLKSYFAAIKARDYEAARRLRDGSGRQPTAQEFAANFERYAEHRATVGTPSLVVEAGEWQYVEVPVQRYGKFRNGKTFVNAGTVSLRRPRNGGAWRIFTS